MTSREPISKGKRFNIFRRDGFTCQYCGRKPPEVVLHIDHILPVVEGGTNDEGNLVTSCQDCNLGKGRKLLDRPQLPDADLAWLEAQQEIAEMRRYQEALATRKAEMAKIVHALQDLFIDYTGDDWVPKDDILMRMLAKYEPQMLEEALVNVASKIRGGYLSEYGDGWVRYLWGMLKTMQRERYDG